MTTKLATPLKIARGRAGLTQKAVAELVGVSLRHYQDVEYWLAIPNVLLAFKIADAVGMHGRERELWEDLIKV